MIVSKKLFMANSAVFFDLGNTLVSRIDDQHRLYSDASDTLKALHDRGYRIGVLSNLEGDISVDDVYGFLKECGIESYIEYDLITISCELPGNILKPDKRIFDLALKKSGLLKAGDESIFVTEEMEHILAARRYGWRAILKRNSGECRPEDGECVTSLSGVLSLL
jgi:FMN phosphatase YigB (HAD superfamily)